MRTPKNKLFVPLIIGCALVLEALDTTVITTALPVMARSLHVNPIRLDLAITAYLLSLAMFVPLSGWVADVFGARKVFHCAIVMFTAGSVFCGLSQSLAQLVAARILQGVGGAMLIPVGRLVVLKTVDKSELIQAMAYLSVPWIIGPVIGPPLGGFIVTYYSWRWIFFINVPVCLIGLVLVTLFVPPIREEFAPPLDVAGFLLTGLGLAGLVFGLETVGRGVFPASLIGGVTAGGMVCVTLYVFHSRRTALPIVDLNLLKVPTFMIATVGGGLYRMGVGAMPFLLSLLLQVGFGMTPFVSGLLTFGSATGSLFMRLTAHRVVRRYGFRATLIANGAISAVSIAFCVLFQQTTPYGVIVLVLVIGGFFRSLQYTALSALTYADISMPLMSNASSLASMAQQLAVSLGVATSALTLRFIQTTHGSPTLTAAEISPIFPIIAGVGLLSVLFYLPLEHHAGAEISGQRLATMSELVEEAATPEI